MLGTFFHLIYFTQHRNTGYLHVCTLYQSSFQPSLQVLLGLLGFLPRQFTKPQSLHMLVQCFTSFLPGHPSTPHFLHVLPFQAVFVAGLLRDFEATDLATAAERD